MNKEEREQIITNNNSATDELKKYLEISTKPLKKIYIGYALFGDIDFSVLKEMNMGVPEEVIFEEGKITNLYNIPEGIETLTINKNILNTLDNLPSSLKYLQIEDNYLQKIDVSNLTNLKELHLSHNKLEEVKDLPSSLIHLSVNSNKLKMLDLKNIINLETLNVSNNTITLIENFPENGIPNFLMENTPSIEFRGNIPDDQEDREKEKTRKKIEVKKALNAYFKLKNKYEKKVHDMKKAVFKNADSRKQGMEMLKTIKPKCIKCKRKVGTIFKRTSDFYQAICGDTENPCALNIKIYTGQFYHYESQLHYFNEYREVSKSSIIREKMNNIFSFTEDEEAKDIFEKLLDNYNLENELYEEMLDTHKELFHNYEKKKEIKNKEKEIYEIQQNNKLLIEEYHKTQNKELIKQIVKNNTERQEPLFKKLSQLNNEVQEVNYDNDSGIYSVFKYPVHIDKIEINTDEEPVVKDFIE